jgi:hypothetical protein
MRTVDKYANLPAADVVNKNIDPSLKIPEDRITEDCIAAITQKLGFSEKIVREVHNFQWAKVKEGTDTFRTIYVSKFFKLRLSSQKVPHYINELQKEISQIDQKIKCVNGNDKKKFQEQKREIEKKIEVLKVQVNKCMQQNKKI